MIFQTCGMEVLHQKPYPGFYAARAAQITQIKKGNEFINIAIWNINMNV